MKKVCVIGAGYVGLTLAVTLSEKNFHVTCVDINESLIKNLQECKPHFYEKGLPLLLRKNGGKTLFFQKSVPKDQDVIILCVGTPMNEETKQPILDYLESSTRQIVPHINDGCLIVVRSTVPLGTSRGFIKPLLDESGKNYLLAFCPERTVEGLALDELTRLPQIIGGIDNMSVDTAFDLFKEMTSTIIRMTSLEHAEMVKLLCNSYRDLNFAFGNEIALLCEKLQLDPKEVINAANTGYERSKIALPGFVGGSCLAKDPYLLNGSSGKINGSDALFVQGRKINENLVNYVCDKIHKKVEQYDKIFISGLAFKGHPETDDIRESPTIKLISQLREKGYKDIYVHDFVVDSDKLKSEGYKTVSLAEGFEGASCVVIGNNHLDYGFLDIDEYIDTMKFGSLFFDVWGFFNPKVINRSGIHYASIGK